MILSIDPGTRALGWAGLGIDGTLRSCGCSRTIVRQIESQIAAHVQAIRHGAGVDFKTVAVEEMVIDGRQVPPQDLLNVQAVGFGVAGAFGPIYSYAPGEWKGTIPKRVHHKRLRNTLDADELAILDRALEITPRENWKEVLDAVGIGCYHTGRTTRAGVERRDNEARG